MIALAALWAAAAPPPDPPSRFGLVVGADDGGPDRVRLRFASADARAVADVLTGLGGVPDDHLVRLIEPDRAAVERAVEALGARIAAVRGASSVVVYYSGHSDAGGLLLGGERYPYADLRRDLDALPATVQVVVVDGCASGAMIRAKGGAAAPAFLASPSHAVAGRAYLMSSSADEVSQEADHLGAGYFTHALVTGLRGGADFDGDGRVTLREAHQFATDETLARTVRSRLGAQHPTFDIQLSGVGDFVLTDVSGAATQLRLGEDLRGRVYLRDEGGHLVAELFKRAGEALALGVPPGRYAAVVDDGGAFGEASVRVAPGRPGELVRADLQPVPGDVTLARGRLYAEVPVAVTLLPYPTSEGLDARDQLHYASLGAIAVHAAQVRGVQLGAAAATTRDGVDGVQLAGGLAYTGGSARGLQLAPITAASQLRGVQLGVVNVAGDHQGLSLGVLHVSRTSRGVPLALVPLVGDGLHHAELWAGTDGQVNLGGKLGSRRVYTQYAAGLGRLGPSAGLGFGVRAWARGGWRVDVDVLHVLAGWSDRFDWRPALRLTAARPLRGEHLAPLLTGWAGLSVPLEGPPGGVAPVRFAPGAALGFRL